MTADLLCVTETKRNVAYFKNCTNKLIYCSQCILWNIVGFIYDNENLSGKDMITHLNIKVISGIQLKNSMLNFSYQNV